MIFHVADGEVQAIVGSEIFEIIVVRQSVLNRTGWDGSIRGERRVSLMCLMS